MAKQNLHSKLYEWLGISLVTTLIISNIASIKMVQAGPLTFDAGTLLFPLSYIIGDIVTEVYGFKRMRGLLIKGVAMLLLTSLTFWIVGLLPGADFWQLQQPYQDILGVVWRIVTASLIAIFVGELLNSYILARLKIAYKGQHLWLRLIGSSAAGSLVDTIIFSTIAFAGTMPNGELVHLIISVYLLKMAVEILVSPLTMKLIMLIKTRDKSDVYEAPELL